MERVSYLPQWNRIEKQLSALVETTLSHNNLDDWLTKWSDIKCEMNDAWLLLLRSASLDSADKDAERELKTLTDEYNPAFWKYEDKLFDMASTVTSSVELTKKILVEIAREKAISSEQNTPLHKKEIALQSAYEVAVSQLKIFTGTEELTTQTLQARLHSTEDRNQRYIYWELLHAEYLEHREEFASIFLSLVKTRQDIAQNVGLPSYREYSWEEQNRTGYTPDDAARLLDMIAEEFEPLVTSKTRREAHLLGLESPKPWDVNLILDQGLKSRTFTQEELVNAAWTALSQMDEQFGAHVMELQRRGAIDIMSRENKRPFTRAIGLTASGLGYINGNLSGHPLDFMVVLHELGHTIHFRYCLPEKMFWTKVPTQEVREFVAFFFQYAPLQFMKTQGLFTATEFSLLLKHIHDEIVSGLQRVSNSERFQHWVYQKDTRGLDLEDLDKGYLNVVKVGNVDWLGQENILKSQWQMRPHVFSYPFRDSAYAVAWVAVLQFLHVYMANPKDALNRLKKMMRLGNMATVEESFATLGLVFPFTKESVRLARETLEEQYPTD